MLLIIKIFRWSIINVTNAKNAIIRKLK